MDPMTYQEAFQLLRRAGFARAEIDRLYQLRRASRTSELDQAPLDLCRLQFIRWLVTTGRLTDQLPGTKGEASLSCTDSPRLRRTFLARFAFSSFRRKE